MKKLVGTFEEWFIGSGEFIVDIDDTVVDFGAREARKLGWKRFWVAITEKPGEYKVYIYNRKPRSAKAYEDVYFFENNTEKHVWEYGSPNAFINLKTQEWVYYL